MFLLPKTGSKRSSSRPLRGVPPFNPRRRHEFVLDAIESKTVGGELGAERRVHAVTQVHVPHRRQRDAGPGEDAGAHRSSGARSFGD